jgi:hypothetical protein
MATRRIRSICFELLQMKISFLSTRFILPILPVIVGMLVLVGWGLGFDSLKQSFALSVPMNPATAVFHHAEHALI